MARVRAANEGAKSTSKREHIPSCFFRQMPRTESKGTNPTPPPADPEREPRWNPEQKPNPVRNEAEARAGAEASLPGAEASLPGAEASLPGATSFPVKLNEEDGIGPDDLSNQTPGSDHGPALPKTVRAQEPVHPRSKGPPARGVKRTRSTRGRQAINDWQHEDPDPVPRRSEKHALLISDESAVKEFYQVRFKELTMKPLRQIVTAWVKRLAPQRNNSFGRYDKRITPAMNPGCRYPPWWPRNAPYNEPAHLKSQYLIPLAINIMMVHCNKNTIRARSWIVELKEDADYIVRTTPVETFSSSTEIGFNESMKVRAQDEVLHSLFDVAKSYEDYCAEVRWYESAGKEYPGPAKTIYWQRIPKPQRGPSKKRKCVCQEQSPSEARGSDTEADEDMEYFSSFSSAGPIQADSEVALTMPSPAAEQVQPPGSVETMPSALNQSMAHLQFTNSLDVECKPLVSAVPGSLFNVAYTCEPNSYTRVATHAAFSGEGPHHFDSNPSVLGYPQYPELYPTQVPRATHSYPMIPIPSQPLYDGLPMYAYTGYPFES